MIKNILVVCMVLLVCMSTLIACDEDGKQSTPNTPAQTTANTTSAPETDPPKADPPESEAHVHSFGEWTTVSAPTCTQSGSEERVCPCGDKETRPVSAKGHTEAIDEAVASTCTKEGLTEGKHCSECGEVLIAQSPAPKAPHTYDNDEDERCNVCDYVRNVNCKHTSIVILPASAPTCTEAGLAEGKTCANCGEVFIAQQAINAKGHTEVIDAAVTATCTESGLTEGKHCSECNHVIIAQTVISAKGHTEVTDSGISPTCTEAGLTEGKHCSVCHTVLVSQTTLPAKGHVEVTDRYEAATCIGTGLTEGKHCSVCNAVLVSQTVIPAKGHHEVTEAEVKPTCTEDGKTERIYCDVCHTVFKESTKISATGHTEVIDAAVEPTCTEDGLTEGKHCSVCNHVTKPQRSIDAKGHTEGEWITDKEATREQEGKRHQICSTCNQTMKELVVPKIDGSVGLKYSVNSDGKTCYITGMGTCTDTDLVIPSSIDGYTVTSISSLSVYNSYNTTVTSITIPASVTNIRSNAFNNYIALETLKLYTNNITIDENAFAGSGVVHLIFENMESLAKTDWKKAVLSRGSSLDFHVTINNGQIPTEAFYNCKNLRKVTIGEGVTEIGGRAFWKCIYLSEVIIKSTNLSFKSQQYTFSECNRIGTLFVENSPADVRWKTVFADSAPVMHTVTVNNGVLCDGAFGTMNGEASNTGFVSLRTVVLGDGVTSIGARAFSGCSSLESFTFGKGVKSVGASAFSNYYPVENVYYTGSIADWCDIDFVDNLSTPMYNNTPVNFYIGGELVTNIVIPNSVTAIKNYTFCGVQSLKSITLHKDITSIGNFAFLECTSLESILIPDKVTTIGNMAFAYCSALKKVTIGKAVTEIAQNSFKGVATVDELTVGNSVDSIEWDVVFVDSCETVETLTVNSGKIGVGAFSHFTKLKTVHIGKGVTNFYRYAFQHCNDVETVYYSGSISDWLKITFYDNQANPLSDSDLYINGELLTELVIPEGITEIENAAFATCRSLKSVIISDSVTHIGREAFSQCFSLESLVIGRNVEVIYDEAFYRCTKLKGTVVIPDKVTYMGYSVFQECTALEGLVLGKGITYINASEYLNCSSLKTVAFSSYVTRIAASAFRGCTSLEAIVYDGTIEQWKAITKGTNWCYGTLLANIRCTDGNTMP